MYYDQVESNHSEDAFGEVPRVRSGVGADPFRFGMPLAEALVRLDAGGYDPWAIERVFSGTDHGLRISAGLVPGGFLRARFTLSFGVLDGYRLGAIGLGEAGDGVDGVGLIERRLMEVRRELEALGYSIVKVGLSERLLDEEDELGEERYVIPGLGTILICEDGEVVDVEVRAVSVG